jgi:hypothetical protein
VGSKKLWWGLGVEKRKRGAVQSPLSCPHPSPAGNNCGVLLMFLAGEGQGEVSPQQPSANKTKYPAGCKVGESLLLLVYIESLSKYSNRGGLRGTKA